MKECAFCDYTGKLSAEHIVSQWLGELFPGPVSAWYGEAGELKAFKTNSMDWKARVICKKCNETWMSDIESKHAKPVLTPLVKGEMNIPINQKSARSIALFAFKTAVVLDHANRGTDPFFSRRLRYAFRKHQLIPQFVQMWMCPYVGHRAGGHVKTIYHQGESTTGYRFLMYVCTCAFGNFTFQVLAVKQLGNAGFRSMAPFREDLAVPFWPRIPLRFVWPHRVALKTMQEFNAFANRWQNVEIIGE
jgi:hypothetical protein